MTDEEQFEFDRLRADLKSMTEAYEGARDTLIRLDEAMLSGAPVTVIPPGQTRLVCAEASASLADIHKFGEEWIRKRNTRMAAKQIVQTIVNSGLMRLGRKMAPTDLMVRYTYELAISVLAPVTMSSAENTFFRRQLEVVDTMINELQIGRPPPALDPPVMTADREIGLCTECHRPTVELHLVSEARRADGTDGGSMRLCDDCFERRRGEGQPPRPPAPPTPPPPGSPSNASPRRPRRPRRGGPPAS